MSNNKMHPSGIRLITNDIHLLGINLAQDHQLSYIWRIRRLLFKVISYVGAIINLNYFIHFKIMYHEFMINQSLVILSFI